MLKYNGRIIAKNDRWIGISYKYHVYTSATHGTVTATPNEARSGTVITLSNSPDAYYEFDYYTVDGIQIVGNTFVMPEHDVTVTAVFEAIPDPYNPLNLPPYTIRLKYTTGVTPSFSKGTATRVSSSPNVWDLTYENSNWITLLENHTDLLEVLGANTTNVSGMERMFWNCSSLTSVPLFDTSNVTDMQSMFSKCSSLTSVPLFVTSNVTDMQGMLQWCTNLTSVPLFDTSKVSNMYEMFYYCKSLTSVPLFDTSNVTNMYMMFDECRSLTSVPSFNTSNVTRMDMMLSNCRSLTSVPSFNTSNVTRMDYMFSNCTNLTSVPLLNTSKVTDMDHMFSNCYNVQSGALALYRQASSQTNPPTEHSQTFRNCGRDTQTGAAELAQIPSDWK